MLPPKTVESLEDESEGLEVPVVGVVVGGVVGDCVPVVAVAGGVAPPTPVVVGVPLGRFPPSGPAMGIAPANWVCITLPCSWPFGRT
jgi:hypothetical protein